MKTGESFSLPLRPLYSTGGRLLGMVDAKGKEMLFQSKGEMATFLLKVVDGLLDQLKEREEIPAPPAAG